MHVLERIDHRESRLDAEQERRVAMCEVQVDDEHIGLAARASIVAVFTDTVVVPTPPLAPTNANTCPACCGWLPEFSNRLTERVGVSGSCTHSFTPARIASSISRGSSVDATRITLALGWSLRNPGSAAAVTVRAHRR